jgi:DNA-binding NarL/FixJ family response regulator
VVLFDESESDSARVLAALAGGEAGLVVLGERRDGYHALAGAELPGWAYLLKEADGSEIAGALRAVAAGLIALDRSLAPFLNAAPLVRSDGAGVTPLPGEALTAREREVLQLMAEGIQNRAIAARLSISPHTVKFHVASILAKLGAASRTEAVTLGARRGYVVL